MGLHDKTPLVYVAVQGRVAPASVTSRIVSLEVDEHTNKATHFTLEIEDTSGAIRSGEVMREGMEIVFRWGYPGAIGPPRAGIIHKIEPSYANDTVHVEAFGKELALSVGAVRRVFRGRTFRQALDDLARDAGMRVEWQAREGIRFDGQALHDEHVWSWVLRRTAELGLEVQVENGAIVVREPAFGSSPIRVLHYEWRNAELIEFTPETNAKKKEGEHAGVVAVFFDPASNTVMSHAAGDPNTTRASLARRRLAAIAKATREARDRARIVWREMPLEQRSLYRTGVAETAEIDAGEELTPIDTFDQDEGQGTQRAVGSTVAASGHAARAHVRQIAEGRWLEAERQRVKAKATADGDPFLRRGKVVQILGSRMSPRDVGLWYIKGCTHRVGDGYTTELELTRDGVNGGRGKRTRGLHDDVRANSTNATAQTDPERDPVDLRDEGTVSLTPEQRDVWKQWF